MRVAILLLAAFLLAGCYVSKTALITPATADYPVADNATFNVFAPAGATWIAHGTRAIRRAGAYYTYSEPGRAKPSLPFLLKRIAPNLYVAQLSDSMDPAKVHEYAYELIRFDGATAIQYSGTCPARADWLSRKLVTAVEDTSPQRCLFTNFANLATVLQEAAKNAAPEAKYVLARPR